MSNKFTCPLFKLSWVLDAAGSSTLSTYKSARIPPRVVHRSSLSSDTSHTHVLSLKPLADNSERGGAHSYTSSLSLARDNIHCAHRRRDTSSPPGTTIIVPRSTTAIAFAVALSRCASPAQVLCMTGSYRPARQAVFSWCPLGVLSLRAARVQRVPCVSKTWV